MKTHTQHEQLTPLEVAQIGERDGWPVKGLVVSDDGNTWADSGGIHDVTFGQPKPYSEGLWRYCARPVERIEFEVGDLVETQYGSCGKIEAAGVNEVHIVRPEDGKTLALLPPYLITSWQPGYGYTTDGELITAPEGWEIVPEGEYVGTDAKYFGERSNRWKANINIPRWKANADGPIRAYARRIDPIAPGHNPAGLTVSQVGEGWRLISADEQRFAVKPDKSLVEVFCDDEKWMLAVNVGPFHIGSTYRTQQPE